MKHVRKIAAFLLAALMVATIAANVRADSDGAAPVSPSYDAVTGSVTEIDGNRIGLDTARGPVNFYLNMGTFTLGNPPQIGDTITAFYNTRLPVPMIYPPQYNAVVLVNDPALSAQVFVDRFFTSGNEMLSDDGLRRLNANNPATEIVSQSGVDASDWDLDGRLLVVVYDTATRSWPPLINAPLKIVVMYEIAIHPGPEPIDVGGHDVPVRDWANYSTVTGSVVEIDANRLRLAVGEGAAFVNMNSATFTLGNAPQIGDTVTAFYDTRLPMTMIYPPQYTAVVLVNEAESATQVFVDRFYTDGNAMLSADGLRRLNAGNPATEIVSQSGVDATDWDLNGRLLVVVYDTSTRSIPPLINAPQKIVVMYEIAVPLDTQVNNEDVTALRDWAHYDTVTGMVTEIVNNRIRLAIGEGAAFLNLNDSTFILGNAPQIGDTVTAFFDTRLPMTMIYPPRYNTVVLVNDPGLTSQVFVDRFYADGNAMLSGDGLRRLNAGNPATEIVSQSGVDASDWDLNGRLLVVLYDTATRSIPPLINAPQKIIVMYEIAVHPGPEPFPILRPEPRDYVTVTTLPATICDLVNADRLVAVVPPAPTAGYDLYYVVQHGETLWSIAFNYYGSMRGGAVGRIYNANRELLTANNRVLEAGMVLTLPAQGLRDPIVRASLNNAAGLYLVRAGDTLASIANTFYGASAHWRIIRDANQGRIGSNNMIWEGQWLIIPTFFHGQ